MLHLEGGETAVIAQQRIDLALRLTGDAHKAGLALKCLGGIGCWLHIADQGESALPFKREYHDIDLVVSRKQRRAVAERLIASGLAPVESFNAVQGETRLMFSDPNTESVVDVFLGVFAMCHQVALDDIAFEPLAFPSVDLVALCLTKLQVVECNEKDLNDVAGLLAFHDLGWGPELLDARRLAGDLARDWGLWRTVTENLERLRRHSDKLPDHAAVIDARIDALQQEIERAPKSMRWRARARVGDRVIWYETPQEPDVEALVVR